MTQVIKATCEGIHCIVSNWIIEIYDTNWLQVVQAKALQATQLVEFVCGHEELMKKELTLLWLV